MEHLRTITIEETIELSTGEHTFRLTEQCENCPMTMIYDTYSVPGLASMVYAVMERNGACS